MHATIGSVSRRGEATAIRTPPSPSSGSREEPPLGRRRSSGRTLVLAGAVLAVALMLAVPVRSWLSQRSDLDRLRADIAASQSRVDALVAQKDRWEDPRYVSGQARTRLNMVRPGESALIALQDEEQRQQQPSEQPSLTTWYEKLWDTTRSMASDDPVADPDGTDAG